MIRGIGGNTSQEGGLQSGGGAAEPKTTEVSRICVTAKRLSVCVMPYRHPSSINIFSKKNVIRKLNCDIYTLRIWLIYNTELSYNLELYVCMFSPDSLSLCKLFSFGPDAVLVLMQIFLGPSGVYASVQISEWLHLQKRAEMIRTLINSTKSSERFENMGNDKVAGKVYNRHMAPPPPPLEADSCPIDSDAIWTIHDLYF